MGTISLELDDEVLAKMAKKGLDAMFFTQLLVSGLVDGAIPVDGGKPTKDQVRTYFLALIGEVYELMQELDWKPWKPEKPEIDGDKVVDEFADIMAFLGLIIVYLNRYGISTRRLADGYAKKSRVNIDRFTGKVPEYDMAGKNGKEEL